MLPTPFAEQIYQPIQNALLTIQNIAIPQQDFVPSMLQSIKIAIHDEIERLFFLNWCITLVNSISISSFEFQTIEEYAG